jgi:signal peptide peptidase SppA
MAAMATVGMVGTVAGVMEEATRMAEKIHNPNAQQFAASGYSLTVELLTHAWAMKPDVLDRMAMVVHRHDAGIRLSAEEINAIRNTKPEGIAGADPVLAAGLGGGGGQEMTDAQKRGYELVGRTGIIPIGGVIAKYARHVNGSSQPRGTSVERIRQGLHGVLTDPNVANWMLLIDSPGGQVSGLGTLAAEIRAATKVKPGAAYGDDMAGSAAYWIAAQAGRVFAAPGSMIGSIGVYAVVMDSSKWHEDRGLKVHLVRAGEAKGIGTDGVAISDSELAVMQAEIDALRAQFVADLAAGRTVLSAEQWAKLADGRVYIGQAAVTAGLVDEITSLSGAIARLNERSSNSIATSSSASGGGGTSVAIAAATIAAADVAKVDAAAGVGLGVGVGVGVAGGGQNEAHSAGATVALAMVKDVAGDSGVGDANMSGQTLATQAGGTGPGSGMDKGAEKVESINLAAEKAKWAKEEADRQAAIRGVAKPLGHVQGMNELVAAHCGDPNKTPEEFNAAALALVAKTTSPTGGGVNVEVGASGWDREASAIETMLTLKAKPSLESALRSGSPQADEVAAALGFDAGQGSSAAGNALKAIREANSAGLRNMRLADIARRCVAQTGQPYAGFDDAELFMRAMGRPNALGRGYGRSPRADSAHSTSDFPILLSNLAGKVLLGSYAEQETVYELFCRVDSANDYKASPLINKSEAANLRKRPEGEKSDKFSFNEEKVDTKVEPASRAFGISFQSMVNDDLGAFTDTPAEIGAAGRRYPEDEVFALLLSNPLAPDGNVLFSTTHGNQPASGSALSFTSLNNGYVAMTTQRGLGEDKAYLSIMPRVLLVAPKNATTAFELTQAPTRNNQSNAGVPNFFAAQGITPKATPRITTADNWFLFAGPDSAPVINVRFFQGQRIPRIFQIETGDPLTMMFDAILLGCDVKCCGHRGGYFDPGS